MSADIHIFESEFGCLPVVKEFDSSRLSRAKLTRDAWIYGGFENAIKERLLSALVDVDPRQTYFAGRLVSFGEAREEYVKWAQAGDPRLW